MSGTREKKTLHLTLKKSAFEVMETGEKMVEFRRPSKWLISRLAKSPDHVIFYDGYKKDRKQFERRIIDWMVDENGQRRKYSNGLTVETNRGDIVIFLAPCVGGY